MFNFLQGGIKNKGRFFKKVIKQGGNLMKGKVFLTLALLCTFVLVGWSCSHKTAAPTDTNIEPETPTDVNEAPAGWETYKSEELGFEFQYPDRWQLRVENQTPFAWGDTEYELIDAQLLDPESGQYIGAYSFAVAENLERLSLMDWLERHNTVNDPFILVDEAYNENVPGKKFTYAAGVTLNPDQQAFPVGTLVFSDPANAHIFFPDLGQDHSIFEIYGISAGDFASQIRSTFRFTR
jgi:hypothetical protein